ncbi:MAG: peptidoglycan-associated lipoprotein Pal [Sphingomonadales bacterium]|nr:peptidoglycan-associated lipoprotein Pal [Sphingomonadales bacterium]MDE2570722.1 peptidoglycan-associated lipoprotein Pal [Sphingomonadales bacterium]
MRNYVLIGSITILSLGLASCAPKPPKQLPPAPSTKPVSEAPSTPAGPIPGSKADFLASVTSDTIHFDTDKYNIDSVSQQILASQVKWLMRYPSKQITIEGHCDERGTREYNLALGERRANAAKDYLSSLGIDPSRIKTISYGKERPIALGSNPEAWAKNRRAVTVVVE